MRVSAIVLAFMSSASLYSQDEDQGRADVHLDGKHYTVEWGMPEALPKDAELEIGDGNGHGQVLRWWRFQPSKDGVRVLELQYKEKGKQYTSKWPPDEAPVTVRRAAMSSKAYSDLLWKIAVVKSAKLDGQEDDATRGFSTNSFWVQARLVGDDNPLVDLDWAGYAGSMSQVEYAKPMAIVRCAAKAVHGLEFTNVIPGTEDRRWASAKFTRDWNRNEGNGSYWWVREYGIITIGVVGDASVLPTLKKIVQRPTKDKTDSRPVYLAINAVTRLLNKDVRDKPVEEMDLEKSRAKVLEFLREVK